MNLPIEAIQDKLAQIEVEENVTIFYACESRRTWGFSCPDND